jgi:hypothetical protein
MHDRESALACSTLVLLAFAAGAVLLTFSPALRRSGALHPSWL